MVELEKFGNIPFTYAALAEMLPDYQSPYDKVSAMEKKGDIIRLKKGVYVVSNKVNRKPISRELIANHLYGPSYISLETALSHYGLIPERVYTLRSITIKRTRQFHTPLGNFEYVTAPQNWFSIGIVQQMQNSEYTYLLATPEKALCDRIAVTPNLRLQSLRAMQTWLEDDLRIDFSAVEHWDAKIVRQCGETKRKQTELRYLAKFLSAL